MPKAIARISTKPALTPTTALIAAHRRAVTERRQADEDMRSRTWPNRPSVTVPEIGANCVVYEPDELTKLAQEHIDRSGMDGVSRIAFRNAVEAFREILVTLITLREEWQKASGAEVLWERHSKAHEAVDAAWKALIARAKADPKSISEISAYCAKGGSVLDAWPLRELLKVVAARKAVRI